MNLGIGIPDGVASVVAEEGLLGKMNSGMVRVRILPFPTLFTVLLCPKIEFVTLTTEPGAHACPLNNIAI